MATPLTDFRSRLRGAGLTEPQAEAISAGFEVLDRKIDAVERRLTEKIDGAERRLAERIDAVERAFAPPGRECLKVRDGNQD